MLLVVLPLVVVLGWLFSCHPFYPKKLSCLNLGEIHRKKSKFSESQIVNILKEAEAGESVEDLSRQHGFSKASFYKWKAKYGGMSISEVKRMKELEEENRRLKQMYANLSLEHEVLKDIIEKKLSK